MVASTAAERLALVRAAIENVLAGGQDTQFDGKRVTEADLGQLSALEQRYEKLAAREARGGGMRTLYGTPS